MIVLSSRNIFSCCIVYYTLVSELGQWSMWMFQKLNQGRHCAVGLKGFMPSVPKF